MLGLCVPVQQCSTPEPSFKNPSFIILRRRPPVGKNDLSFENWDILFSHNWSYQTIASNDY